MTERPRKLVHVERLPIRWGDMDALGHVNSTVYFRYMEQARIAFMEQAGVFYGEHTTQGFVIVNAHCNFRKALVYPGMVEVRMSVGAPGRSSVDSHYDIACRGEVFADGSAKMVWIDLATQRSAQLPEALRAIFA